MPYLDINRRNYLDKGGDPQTGADLDYLFLKVVDQFHAANGFNAERIITVLGALEGAKLEYYRRLGVPYEGRKAQENGDVFTAPVIQSVYARDTVPQGRSSLAEANAQAEQAAVDAADEAAGGGIQVAPLPPPRKLDQDGVEGVEGGGFEPTTGNLSGNPNLTVGEQEGKETDDGPGTDRPGTDPNST